ncbi:metal ABC transporter substrate-binding protein [Kineococcus rubinsiae]|uniref:metal ABC transporter substrate-binding protein n=1 Tax=Kineococcus rubinsiae TaxID=2609562 RepID=UPI0014301BCE|nr:metal ABC transporter substrate-binding protein [Kineococcus rubinsiae]NIZ91827.1 zinc ABC transporter substrate-binding protein [Kineococcus rubinsiae]
MNPLPRKLFATALLAAATTLAACGGGAAAQEDRAGISVVTSSYPLEFVAAAVAGGRAQVANLTPPGADTHGLELSPQQVGSLGEADLVVHLSGLQPAVDAALDQQAPAHVVDAAPLADLRGDPHFWLDPRRMADLGHDVAAGLTEVDPAGAAEYDAAAGRLEDSLTALDTEFTQALEPCRGATLVTSHEAFGYLAARYGLQQVGIAGIDPHVEPTPARVRDVVDAVRGRGVRTVFFEATTSPAVAETFADDLGAGTSVLHPVERVGTGQDYPGLLHENLEALRTGLTCG